MDLSAEKIVKNYKQLESQRSAWSGLYQKLHDFFYVESGNVIDTKDSVGVPKLLDSTSLDCADVLAAGLSNYLTPESSKWLFLQHSNPEMREDDEVKTWMQEVSDEVLLTLSRSNFYNQMPIFYKASGVYGTAALFAEKDSEDGVRFYNIPISKTFITEDARERPSEFYLVLEYTAEQALSRFGSECSQAVKDDYANGRSDKKYKFLCYFGKRQEREDGKIDKANMPVRMAWVDVETRKIVKEDGFMSMPVVAHRFYKRAQEVYGYSPAMKALPYVRAANTIADTMLRAGMKLADPPIALPDDAFLGTPNFNPRQINYYRRGSLTPKDDIIPIGNYGQPALGIEFLEYYQQQIRGVMFYETFQAFSSITKQMTVPEVMERVSEKMTLLGPAVGRFMNDVLQPLIEKVVFILFDSGRLPDMPDIMKQDPSFEVKFVGRLIQSQRQSEVNNIVNALTIAGQIAQFKPEVLDLINGDAAIEEVFDITGVSQKIINDESTVDAVRNTRAQQQAQAEQLTNAASAAQTYKTAAEGAKNETEASDA